MGTPHRICKHPTPNKPCPTIGHGVCGFLDHLECDGAFGKAIDACTQALSLLELHNQVGCMISEWQTGTPPLRNRERQHPYKIIPADWRRLCLRPTDMPIE